MNIETMAQVRKLLAASLLLLGGCEGGDQESNNDEDIADIEAVSDQLTAAYVARDWDVFAGFFTDDGVWLPPGMPALSGKDEWWLFVEPWWHTSTVVDMGVTHEEIIIVDDWAIERHSEYQTLRSGDDEETVTIYFKGIWILQRQNDGEWKIARYIWNENAPPD
jgi:uncharacterized protein (TIGR02246 family)